MADAAASPAPASAGGGSASAAPLDDVMMAMDVVDTLRHAEKLVERELSSDERARQLKERLRQIYTSQGLEVSERILDEGVAALEDERFVYDPPNIGASRWLAMIWIRRKRWGKAVAIGLVVLAVAGAGYYFGVKRPAELRMAEQTEALTVGLPRDIAAEVDRIKAVSQVDKAVEVAERLATEGLAAAKAGDLEAARGKVGQLQAVRQLLEQEYMIRIVGRPGQQSGIFRIPDANPNARNYYLIVEAIDAGGRPVTVQIISEEQGKTGLVDVWGLRVSEATFDRVRADKQDDGIIQNNRVGVKRRGYLQPEYEMPVQGGAILEW